jgi:serine/threonine-protein kinase
VRWSPRDSRIGRDVAIKYLRAADPSPELVDRFLREAKIQARLDHPAIVPVYELGHDRAGRPYFTMKRLAGTTLLDRLGKHDATQQSLLRAFVDVCQAIGFAHSRGVVHRDLKPANIMLGDYGEVYVLDWGVARVIERAPTDVPVAASPSLAPEAHTQAGALLGTPGYMAPEQTRAEIVTPAADVYALGCILFEILVGQPLHPRGGEAIASTLLTPTQSPSARGPEVAVAPELDAACTAALAADPAMRPRAGELATRVQAYLDGDRDHERRTALAADLVARAQAAARRPDGHADAIRHAGRALALDPSSHEAAALVMTLMLQPPAQLPPQLMRHLDEIDARATRHTARIVSRALPATLLLAPLGIMAGIVSWPLFAAIFGLIALICVDAFHQARTGRINLYIPLVLGGALLIAVSRLMGSVVMQPTMITVFVVGLSAQPVMARRPALVLGASLATFAIPIALELAGVFERSWRLSDNQLVATSRMFHVSGTPAYVFIVATNVLLLTLLFTFVRAMTVNRTETRRKVEIHAWQLSQLLPPSGR